MNAFEKFLAMLDGQMTKPVMFGWFHLMWWAIMIVGAVILCVFAVINKKKGKDNSKFVRIVVLTYAIVNIILEIYKQLNYSFNSTTGEWNYQWQVFPFQFCSTPMYVALIAGCLKKCEFQKWLYTYLATFALFAGLCVMVYSGDVFTTTIGINIQTMVCHAGMVVMGIFLLASGVVDLKWSSILKAIPVFCVLVVVALIMNIIFHSTGNTALFNMFHISPYIRCTLVILGDIWDALVPTFYIVFFLIYVLGFSLAAFIMLSIAIGIDRLSKFIERKINPHCDDKSMTIIFKNLKNLS